MRSFVKTAQTKTLLHNKFVMCLGGSAQRLMYKDLQTDNFLTLSKLKSKVKPQSLHSPRDTHESLFVNGGALRESNGFAWVSCPMGQTKERWDSTTQSTTCCASTSTRVDSVYMQNVLEQLREGLRLRLRPDLVIVSSCVLDMMRFGLNCLDNFKEILRTDEKCGGSRRLPGLDPGHASGLAD